MSNKAFHDEILRQGSMPIALIRLTLTRQKRTHDMAMDWKFYGEVRPRTPRSSVAPCVGCRPGPMVSVRCMRPPDT